MATTTGLVQRITRSNNGDACVQVGSSVTQAEAFVLSFDSADAPSISAFKRSVLHLLTEAELAGYPVVVTHATNDSTITAVSFAPFDISPIGPAIHGDFYCVSGSGIPSDAILVFESDTVVAIVTPNLVRPHLAFVAQLPTSIPLGRVTVRLQASSWRSDAVPIDVSAGPLTTVRVLYSGDPKPAPYSIVFVANPALTPEVTALYADPVLTDRPGYANAVSYCLSNVLLSTEDVLRQGDLDAHIRVVSVFDATVTVNDANSLAVERMPNIIEPRRDKVKGFLAPYAETRELDFVVVLTKSSAYDRASAWYTSDDNGRPGTAYVYDGTNRTHRHFSAIPGTTAIPISTGGLTPFHEFGHAASDFVNGALPDLYDDRIGGFLINKKARARPADPIPTNFATYAGTTYGSDQNRDSLGYPSDWTSFHPQPIDGSRPNAMDNFWFAANPPDPRTCRLDRLAYAWLTDRLRAKIFR